MPNIGPKEQALREQREAKFRGRNPAASTTTAQLRALQENVKMKTKTEKKTAAPKRKAKGRASKTKAVRPAAVAKPSSSDGAPRGEKLAAISSLLTRKGGCTAADILEATGWPTVSVPAQAKAAGLALTKTKEGRTFRYHGTPVQSAA